MQGRFLRSTRNTLDLPRAFRKQHREGEGEGRGGGGGGRGHSSDATCAAVHVFRSLHACPTLRCDDFGIKMILAPSVVPACRCCYIVLLPERAMIIADQRNRIGRGRTCCRLSGPACASSVPSGGAATQSLGCPERPPPDQHLSHLCEPLLAAVDDARRPVPPQKQRSRGRLHRLTMHSLRLRVALQALRLNINMEQPLPCAHSRCLLICSKACR